MNQQEQSTEGLEEFALLHDEKLASTDGVGAGESVPDEQKVEILKEAQPFKQETGGNNNSAASEGIVAEAEIAKGDIQPEALQEAAVVEDDAPVVADVASAATQTTQAVVRPEKKPVKKPQKPLKPAKNSALAKKTKGKNGKKRSNKKRIVWTVVVLVFIAAVVGIFFLLQGLGVPVNTAKVETNDVAITVFATGAITPGESRDVYPETQGIIESVHVRPGDMVERGDILATLDNAASQAQLSQAEAALAQAKSGLTQAETARTQATSGVTAAQASLDAANASLESAETIEELSSDTLSSARRTVRRMENSNASTADPASFAQAQAAVTQAELGLAQAQAGVAQAQAGVAQARAALEQARAVNTASTVDAAQASIEAAEDGVALAESALEATIIRAPKDGMVLFAPTAASAAAMGTGITPTSGTEIMAGSAVAPGSPLFTIVDESVFSFTAEVDEVDIRRIELGQFAEITLTAYSGRAFAATVSNINQLAMPTITGGTVFEVELAFSEQVDDIRIGMRGDTIIEIETQHDVLTIPIDAWFSEAGTDFVYVINDEDILAKTPIIVGVSTEFLVEVIDGLEEGDTVAMASGAAVPLEDGLPVTVVP